VAEVSGSINGEGCVGQLSECLAPQRFCCKETGK
jgi:hypothetical protein